MTKRSFIKFVILCTVGSFIATGFYNFAGVTAFAFSETKDKRKQPIAASELKTERAVYKKGENAVIYGSGFRKFEQVTIRIEQFDNQIRQNILRGTWVAVADEKGSFVSTWVVPFDGRFVVKGIGAESKKETETIIMASVTPIVVSGNPNCAAINASSDPAFAHITSNFGFKIDPPASGTFTFTNGSGKTLTGGAPSSPTSTVTVTIQNSTTFDWLSNRAIKAVIVKGGPNANVYPYNPFSFGDTTLTTVNNSFGISHIEFCFEPFVSTAARVSVSGHVADEFGIGIPRTTLTIFNTTTSETKTAISNSFGYYQFDGLEVGSSYIVSATNKRYSFENNQQLLVLNDAVGDLNFTGLAQ